MPQDIGFLPQDGVAFPANARGVPWAGALGYDYQTRTILLPPKDRFEVWRLDGARPRPVPFEVESVSDSFALPGKFAHSQWLYLIAPREWVAGARYRFVDREARATLERAPKRKGLTPALEVRVAGTRAGNSKGSYLFVGPPDPQELSLTSLGGMCSQRVRLTTRRLRFALPSHLQQFQKAFLYTVVQHTGQTWLPTKSLCSPGAPGRSQWLDAGYEYLMYDCKTDRGAERTVRMIAWLPGTNIRLETMAGFERDCE